MSVKSRPARNALTFLPGARSAIRAVARWVNPLVLTIAGRRFMPIVGIVRHRGRSSGRLYATPLGMRPLGDGFVIPMTFSERAQWYLNIRAAGGCVIRYRGSDHTVSSPEIISRQAAQSAIPGYERALLRALGIDEYLWLHAAPAG